jgi:transposase
MFERLRREGNLVRVVDFFIEELDLAMLSFAGVVPKATGHPSRHPATLLKIYLSGCLNQAQSSRTRPGPSGHEPSMIAKLAWHKGVSR